MSEAQVVMYTTSWCPYCARARRLLQDKAVAFAEIDVEARPEARAEMRRRSGGCATVPQIFIGETFVGGCDDLLALEAAGQLDVLLRPEPEKRS
jgi:glutaredoxin 3